MTDTLSRIVRTAILALLAIIGMGMALIFMVSTAIAVGVFYIVAKLRGKPFGARAYWSQRRAAGQAGQAGQQSSPFQAANPFTRTQARRPEIVDVEAREVR